MLRIHFVLWAALTLSACSSVPPTPEPVPDAPVPVVVAPPPAPASVPAPAPLKIGLALGGGAARGFAHVGVIKALEANGIVPDLIVGTSAGSVVGALYASGMNARELQGVAARLQQDQVGDWGLPDRGFIKGEALQNFINRVVKGKPLEALARPFGAVATDLKSGAPLVFRTGNTGMAVRASSAVPGVFRPVPINDREYVDGGLVSPVPVRAAREMGADFVIAVDISAPPDVGHTASTLDLLLQTFTIMVQSISRIETGEADVLIRPVLGAFSATDFTDRARAIAAGEKAVNDLIVTIRARIDARRLPARIF